MHQRHAQKLGRERVGAMEELDFFCILGSPWGLLFISFRALGSVDLK